MIQAVFSWAHKLKQNIVALYIAYRHPETPLLGRIVAFCIVAYALSPIDLIPDFIPVLGYLDDVILLPAGILLAIHLIPDEIMEQSRITAQKMEKPASFRWMTRVIIAIWIILLLLTLRVLFAELQAFIIR